MSNDVYEILHTLDQMAELGKNIIPHFEEFCKYRGTEFLAQYIYPDTFPFLYEALN